MTSTRFAAVWDELLSEGVVAATAHEVAARAGTTVESVYVAAHYAKAANKLFSPTPGLYVLVPPEYRARGTVPADWFIDDLMRHLGRDYYVSLMSAAALHGAGHQAVQAFQVMTDQRLGSRDIGSLRLRFYRCSDLDRRPTTRHNGPTGMLTIATPETCALDLAERPHDAGGVNTILEILADLEVDGNALAAAAAGRARAVLRRCGWLLEHSGAAVDLSGLRELAAQDRSNPTPLVPGSAGRGEMDRAWSVVVNTLVGGDR